MLFSRKTILAAIDTIPGLFTHLQINRFLLDHGLETAPQLMEKRVSKQERADRLARFLFEDPDRTNYEGQNLTETIVRDLVGRSGERAPEDLTRALKRDGFSVSADGRLRATLPEAIKLPEADDEVHSLCDEFGLQTAKGHLDQGIEAHSRGDWAAANAQFRTFIESLLDEIAEILAQRSGQKPLPAPGHHRRVWLAKLNPPFFFRELYEWTHDGKGFFEAFFRRLHPQGSHPGLSDEEDSTFRLHLVLIASRVLLRRFQERVR